jgi:lipoprotein-anchoring transpeptidase ErfK/SrfK
MIRPKIAILVALPLAIALLASAARAQYYSASSSPYVASPDNGVAVERLPPPGTNLGDNGDYVPTSRRAQSQAPGVSQAIPGYSGRTEALPPPGFAAPYAHQIDTVPRGQPPAAAGDGEPVIRPPAAIGTAPQAAPAPQGAAPPAPADAAALPPEDQPETGQPKELPANLKRQLVDFSTKEPAGTIVVDTANTYLYLVLGGGKALRYGVRVGREGFTWTGTERISKMKEWPDWFPPPEMIERQPYLPRIMAGGPGNPLGARAMYLGHTLYRIHGTNQPSTIGHYVSSGCVGMLNEDVEDLYSRVQVGTRVVVLPGKAPETAANTAPGSGASATNASVMVEPEPSANTAAVSNAGISSRPLPAVR